MKNEYADENRCDGYCRIKPGFGDVIFNDDDWGNGIIYRSDIAYRMNIHYDPHECGRVRSIEVKNGKGCLYFPPGIFARYFYRM